jgi:hypothetical protein
VADVCDEADCTGDISRGLADLAKSCVHTSNTGFLAKKPLLLTRTELGVPGIGEAPRVVGDPAAKERVSGNEMVGFTFIFSLLPPNLKKPLRCDEVEVEVGREAGIETSLERDDAVVLCVSSTSSAGASGSESRLLVVLLVVCIGGGIDEIGEVVGLALRLGLGIGLECKLGEGRVREDTDGGSEGGGVALVVANLAAIGGKETARSEPKPEDIGGEVDAAVDNGMLGIGGTTAVCFAFRLKNDGDFFGLPESEDFEEVLVFL